MRVVETKQRAHAASSSRLGGVQQRLPRKLQSAFHNHREFLGKTTRRMGTRAHLQSFGLDPHRPAPTPIIHVEPRSISHSPILSPILSRISEHSISPVHVCEAPLLGRVVRRRDVALPCPSQPPPRRWRHTATSSSGCTETAEGRAGYPRASYTIYRISYTIYRITLYRTCRRSCRLSSGE